MKGKSRHTCELSNLPLFFFIYSSRVCLPCNDKAKALPLSCTVALFKHGMRFLTLAQESFDHRVHLNAINAAGESRCVP